MSTCVWGAGDGEGPVKYLGLTRIVSPPATITQRAQPEGNFHGNKNTASFWQKHLASILTWSIIPKKQ